MKLAELVKSEKGAITIIMAAAMVVLAGMMALVTDAGLLYLNQTKMTNALDSAVLAGVQELPEHSELAIEVALDYAEANGLDPSEVTFDLNLDDYVLTGQATRNVNLLFARVLGFNNTDVSAQSKAKISSLSAATGILPFGVLAYEYSFGEEIILKSGGGESFYPGWYGALRLGGNGAPVYYTNIINGYPGTVRIGDVIDVEGGVMSNRTKQGINERINACKHTPKCTCEGFVEGCPRLIIIPMVTVEGKNPENVEVVGFGAFLIDQYVAGQGNECQVKGSFVRYMTSGEADDNLNTHFGVYSAKLCR
ncbi:MAG: hypothetical protein GX808_14300 [Syntrophomonadaceae bacterium]|nr:hypothetical protein [Syntrophomonadaceae bacterium]